MKYITVFFVAVCLLLATTPLTVSQEMPKPAPELKRLDYFAGQWTSEGEIKPGPMGPAGKFTIEGTCEWFEGGFALVCLGESQGPMGPSKTIAILSYQPNEKVYTHYVVDSRAPPEQAKGTVEGDTWTFTAQSKMNGKSMKSRSTIKEMSSASYTFKGDTSIDGGPWTIVIEGKATKSGTSKLIDHSRRQVPERDLSQRTGCAFCSNGLLGMLASPTRGRHRVEYYFSKSFHVRDISLCDVFSGFE
jgi:hypothetical protein